MPRSKIFNTLEWEAFESPPVFGSGDRKRFFSLPLALEDALADLRTPTNKVCFLEAAGYFKARYKFFPRQFHPNDIVYVARQMAWTRFKFASTPTVRKAVPGINV